MTTTTDESLVLKRLRLAQSAFSRTQGYSADDREDFKRAVRMCQGIIARRAVERQGAKEFRRKPR